MFQNWLLCTIDAVYQILYEEQLSVWCPHVAGLLFSVSNSDNYYMAVISFWTSMNICPWWFWRVYLYQILTYDVFSWVVLSCGKHPKWVMSDTFKVMMSDLITFSRLFLRAFRHYYIFMCIQLAFLFLCLNAGILLISLTQYGQYQELSEFLGVLIFILKCCIFGLWGGSVFVEIIFVYKIWWRTTEYSTGTMYDLCSLTRFMRNTEITLS